MAIVYFFIFYLLVIGTVFWLLDDRSALIAKRRGRLVKGGLIWLIAVPLIMWCVLMVALDFPPTTWERHRQRQQVLQRVQSAGGWEALSSDCILLAKHTQEMGLVWIDGRSHGANTNYQLPPAIAALKPRELRYLPQRFTQPAGDAPQLERVRIKIYGLHATGRHSTPYYGLDVVWGPGTSSYLPEESKTALGNAHSSYRLVAANIYEVY